MTIMKFASDSSTSKLSLYSPMCTTYAQKPVAKQGCLFQSVFLNPQGSRSAELGQEFRAKPSFLLVMEYTPTFSGGLFVPGIATRQIWCGTAQRLARLIKLFLCKSSRAGEICSG